ncbi:MAG TPA: hypothetical protein PKJ33_02010 [Alphaproteobacteria bacterium]|nr:hypothetical protein [Alphaproteobacteria bacterium]
MKNKLIVILLTSLTFALPANAINVLSGARSWWGYSSRDSNGSAGDFMIAGSLGMGGIHGTFDDEWAIAGMVAQKIVEHGGYFCPYQIQCENTNRKRHSWTNYYYPNGSGTVGCSWICEPGYGGMNCLSQSTSPSVCDTKIYGISAGQKFGGLSLKTSGGSSNGKESEVSGFDQFGDDPESDVLLGILKFGQHGVVVGPVKVTCGRSGWDSAHSYVSAVGTVAGTQKLLCANGYKANSDSTDCIAISEDICATQNTKFCDGFAKTGYSSAIHSLEQSSGCAKFFCTDATKAFAKLNDYSCVDCSVSIKGGVSKINGLCVQCQTGQYFDKVTSSCKTASAYTKVDLQYGKSKTKNTVSDLTKQCWILVNPSDYKKCTLGSDTLTTATTIDTTTGITTAVVKSDKEKLKLQVLNPLE